MFLNLLSQEAPARGEEEGRRGVILQVLNLDPKTELKGDTA